MWHKIFRGFTLAEVIIVVGIIGIVAELSIPTLYKDIQNQELHTQFKKTYSELNQIAIQFKQDNGITIPEYTASNWYTFTTEDFWKYFKGNNKVLHHTWGTENILYKINSMNNKPGEQPSLGICDVSSYYSEISGKIYTFNDSNTLNTNGPIICVDINGIKKPNRYGRDNFLFIFTLDGTAIPMGQENKNNSTITNFGGNFFVSGPENCERTSSYPSQFGCAYYALLNQHPTEIGKDYWHDFLNEK